MVNEILVKLVNCRLCVFISGEYGIPRPWYFIFQINYWGGIPLEAGMPIPPAPTEQDEGTRLWKLLYISSYELTYFLLHIFFTVTGHQKVQS